MNPVSNPPTLTRARPLNQNRRRGNRHRLEISAMLLAEGLAVAPIPVTVTEMSIAGVGLRAGQSLSVDQVYLLTSFDTLLPPGMRVKIVSQQPVSGNQFKIGAQTV